MFSIKAILHKELTRSLLDKIIMVKTAAWPYPYEEQKKWIDNNIKGSDIHFLLLKENKAIAYLNLIDIEVDIDNCRKKAFGVGNVCAIEKGKGYGNELMKLTNEYIIEKKRVGLLFCKSELVDFYKKFSWIQLGNSKLVLTFDNNNIETMIYNFNHSINKLQYNGKSF